MLASLPIFEVVAYDLEISCRLECLAVSLRSRHGCLELRHVRDDEVVVVDVHVPYYHLRVRDNLVRLDLPAEVLVRLGV